MWQDLAMFKSMCDKKPTDQLTDDIAQAFMEISRKSTPNKYKNRCTIDEVLTS